jgi:hypothetical protein
MRLFSLYATSIIAGFCMMALELMGGRILQPIFGSSIDVWAAIISVFILSLSVGYVIGGRIADRAHTSVALGWMLMIAGIWYCLLPVVALPFMESLSPAVQTSQWGVLLAALVLFLVPSLLLGAVSPVLVRLVFAGADRVGRTTGTLYAIGSIGNVLGVLVSDYALMKYFELNHNIFVMGIALCLLGLAHIIRKMPMNSHLHSGALPGAAPVVQA